MAIAIIALTVALDASPAAVRRTASGMLSAIAQASSRPAECGGGPSTQPTWRANVWDKARHPTLGAYCDRLARAYGMLASSPATSYADAEAAERLWPGHAAPWILKARASARLDRIEQSLKEFEHARARDGHALDDPATLRDWAFVLARLGRTGEALLAYRTLGPRMALAYSAEERGTILLDAAEAALAHGPSALDDAIAFLEEARKLRLRTHHGRVLAELGLALDRRGDHEEANIVLAPLVRASDGVALPQGTLAGTAEIDAAIALLMESQNPAEAMQRWARYLAGAGGLRLWAPHARGRQEALEKARPAGQPTMKANPRRNGTTPIPHKAEPPPDAGRRSDAEAPTRAIPDAASKRRVP